MRWKYFFGEGDSFYYGFRAADYVAGGEDSFRAGLAPFVDIYESLLGYLQ